MKFRKTIDALIFFCLLFIDQIIKYLIRASGGFYICNINLAFGINLPHLAVYLFAILTVLFISINFRNSKHEIPNPKQIQNLNDNFGYLNLKNWNLEFRIYAILIASGAFSNIIDRLYLGCVIDFIDLKFWPVFNLADIYITFGAIMILVKTLKYKS